MVYGPPQLHINFGEGGTKFHIQLTRGGVVFCHEFSAMCHVSQYLSVQGDTGYDFDWRTVFHSIKFAVDD